MVDVKDLLIDMVETGMPLNRILRDFDYSMNSAQKTLLSQILLNFSKETWRNKNGDLYRVIELHHEVRFEYIYGTPYIDIPWTGDAAIGVNTVDFALDCLHKNRLKSYVERVGSICYRFDWGKTYSLGNDLRILKYYFEEGNDKQLAVSRYDGKPGYTVCCPSGFKLVIERNSELVFHHAVVGMWGRRVLLNYAYF